MTSRLSSGGGPHPGLEWGSCRRRVAGADPKQLDVLGLLLLGRSMVQIARALGISEHTANDHRKAIYRRVGVNSRSELAGLLQGEQYDPRVRRRR